MNRLLRSVLFFALFFTIVLNNPVKAAETPKTTIVSLMPPKGSPTAKAGGYVVVQYSSISNVSQYLSFKVNGKLINLVPNRKYKVYICNNTGGHCATNTYPAITTDKKGNVLFSGLLFSMNYTIANPLNTVKVVDEVYAKDQRGCTLNGIPCLRGTLKLQVPTPTPTVTIRPTVVPPTPAVTLAPTPTASPAPTILFPTPTIFSSPTPTASPSPTLIPTPPISTGLPMIMFSQVELRPPSGSLTPKGYAKINVVNHSLIEYLNDQSNSFYFELSGTLQNLIPNKTYLVWLCGSGGCSTNSNPNIITDSQGNATFGMVKFGVRVTNSRPILTIKVEDVPPAGPMPSDSCRSNGIPCLQAYFGINAVNISQSTQQGFNAALQCSDIHSGVSNKHLDLIVYRDTAYPIPSEGIMTIVKDSSTGQMYRLVSQFSGTYNGIATHDSVVDVFNWTKGVKLETGKTYTVQLWKGDFRYDALPSGTPERQMDLKTDSCN